MSSLSYFRGLSDEDLEQCRQELEVKLGRNGSVKVMGINLPLTGKNQKALHYCEIEQQRRLFFSADCDEVDLSTDSIRKCTDLQESQSNASVESIGFPSDLFEETAEGQKQISFERRKLRTQSSSERKQRFMEARTYKEHAMTARSLPVTPSSMPKPGLP